MKAIHSPMSVADYCNSIVNKKIIVNLEYQRKEGLWNAPARSFFIESILLEYPIPKIFLYSKIDLKTKETVKEIVDGQQRSQALVEFFSNRLALSKNIDTEELRGLRYNNMEEDWQSKFLNYPLPIDQFSGIADKEVREAFRRMNANNVPLNAEEQRNASYQGPFKWFIVSIGELYKETLFRIGLFSRRDMIRMLDLRLYAETAYILENKFQTIKGIHIDRMYRKYNVSFEQEEIFRKQIVFGINAAIEHPAMRQEVFLRMHMFQSFVLALIDYSSGGLLDAAKIAMPDAASHIMSADISIDALAQSLYEPNNFPELSVFILASTNATNTGNARAIRFLYFRSALNTLG